MLEGEPCSWRNARPFTESCERAVPVLPEALAPIVHGAGGTGLSRGCHGEIGACLAWSTRVRHLSVEVGQGAATDGAEVTGRRHIKRQAMRCCRNGRGVVSSKAISQADTPGEQRSRGNRAPADRTARPS